MEETKCAKEILMTKKSGTYNYKIIITTEVERKIRYICQKVWNVEWSGVLFFTYSGSFENNDLVIRCVDIYVMDIGSQAYTEFDMDPNVIAYICESEDPNLLDCQMGLIHSHNNMPTFFSGTDIATLEEEGKDKNNFVSLIVNNEGIYTAAITRKVKSKQVVRYTSTSFFSNEDVKSTEEYIDNKEEIEWFPLEVEKENECCLDTSILPRLEEIRRIKAETAENSQVSQGKHRLDIAGPHNILHSTYPTKEYGGTESIQKSLPFNDNSSSPEDFNTYLSSIKPDEATLRTLILQLLTGSIIISDESKIDINKWARSMPTLYEKRFGGGKDGMGNFKIWAETYLEYLLWNTPGKELTELNLDESEICSVYANSIMKALAKLPENDYIKEYINILKEYSEI